MSAQTIIDMAAARGLAKNLNEDQATLLRLILSNDNMKGIFLDELEFHHGPRMNLRHDDSIKLIGALDYALGRSTSVPHTIADELMNHWEYFTSPEKHSIVEKIEVAMRRNGAGMQVDVAKWQEVLDHAEMSSAPRP